MIETKIAEVVKEFSEWAKQQSCSVWYINMFRDLYISDLHTNIHNSTNSRDKIYWIKRCTSHFEEKFGTSMPQELTKKIFVLESLRSFERA